MSKKEWDSSPGNENDHYSGKIQPTEFIGSRNLSFLEGNVVKYISRYTKKAGKLDLDKALWYIDRIIDRTDGKDFTEEYSAGDFSKSQGFSELETEILCKFMMALASGNACDLYKVRDLIKTLKFTVYGNS
jgi:hypothetical protein